MSEKLDYAVHYAECGFSVFPVCSPDGQQCLEGHGRERNHCTGKNVGKTPLVQWKVAQTIAASEEQIHIWWGQWPNANIGLATGKLSGICVIDLDGPEALEEAKRRGLPQGGPTVETGRHGGRHIYCAYREDEPRNFAKAFGIDYRGEGGYVVLPPSVHWSGARYEWALSPSEAQLPALPQWINEIAQTHRDGSPIDHGRIDIGQLFADPPSEGDRNWTAFRVASKLRAVDVPLDVALGVLLMLAARCRPPLDPHETQEAVQSAYKRYQPSKARYEQSAVTISDTSIETAAEQTVNRDINRVLSGPIRVEI